MNKEIVKTNEDKFEKALMEGDLSKLSINERANLYAQTCQSLGLNHLTKPFQYINLKGKLTLYATKACTDQLRKIHKVSITIKDQKAENGLYLVTVEAKDKDGRVDSDVGAVPLVNANGEFLSNIIMKTVTKAKRRVTLSICGLGILDESEIDTINKKDIIEVNKDTGEFIEVNGNGEIKENTYNLKEDQKERESIIIKIKKVLYYCINSIKVDKNNLMFEMQVKDLKEIPNKRLSDLKRILDILENTKKSIDS